MKHRIFVGIIISEKLQEEILSWQKRHCRLPVRWILPPNLHITLMPPWYESDLDPIKDKLKSLTGKFSSFSVEFHAVTFGPDPKHPRLIWAEGPYNRKLADIKDKLASSLKQPAELRSFQPHLTLARFRPQTFSSFRVKQLNEKISWKEEVKAISLVESHLTPAGATYNQIVEIII